MSFSVIEPSTFCDDWPFIVRCPVCGDDYQHHEGVREFRRMAGEDGETVLLDPGRGTILPTRSNPSPRRGAVTIDFVGECGHEWTLAILQHKGQTFIEVILP